MTGQHLFDGQAYSQISVLRDYPEWHRGRRRYALWGIDAQLPAIQQRMRSAQTLLGDWLHPGYRRQAHITLFVCGFPCQNSAFNDDIAMSCLAAQQRVLQDLAATPFELQIGGLGSFASAPYLQVNDPQQRLPALRAALAGMHPEVRQSHYLPHLTLGLYQRRVSRAQWQVCCADWLAEAPLSLPVDSLYLLSYRADELYGPLRYDGRLALPG